MKTPKPILFTAGLLFQFVIQAQIQWYQNQDGNNQPAGTYATKIESLTPHSFVAAYLWQRDNENYTWKISKSHINGAEQRTFFLSGPSAIAEIKTGYRNSVYVLFRSFPFAQDPQYTLYKLDSNLTIKAQRSIHFPNNFCIFNLNAFELDDAGNVYMAGDGQYPEGPGFSPASFIIKTDKHLTTRWSRMDSVPTSYTKVHIERNGTIRLVEDYYGYFPDIKVQKISAGGQLLQTKTVQTDAGRQSLNSVLDKDDNLLLYGTKEVSNGQAMYLNKVSRYTGNIAYRRTFFTAPGVQLDDLKLDKQGNIFALLSQYEASGSQCRVSRIHAGNGIIYWSRFFPFAQDSCMLKSIVATDNDRLYVIGERRSGLYFSKGFAVQLRKNGHRENDFPSPDSVSYQRSHSLLQGIADRDDRLIAIGNTNDLDTITGSGSYYRAFAVRFGTQRHHHGCDDNRPAANMIAEVVTEELSVNNKLTLYPNPAQSQLMLSNIEQDKYDLAVLYDMRRHVLAQQKINSATLHLDVSRLAGGMYMLVLRSSKGNPDRSMLFAVKR